MMVSPAFARSLAPASPDPNGVKNLEKIEFRSPDLQALEIPENRRRNLWKALHESPQNLRFFGKRANNSCGRDPTNGAQAAV